MTSKTLLIIIYISGFATINAQSLDKMNKSELKEYSLLLASKIDSLKDQNSKLENYKAELIARNELLGQKYKANEAEVSRLSQIAAEYKSKQQSNETEIKRLNQKNQEIEGEIIKLKGFITECQNNTNALKAEKETLFAEYNATIKIFADSIHTLKARSNSNSGSKTTGGRDFLNEYYFRQFDLNNNAFRLILSKVIYGAGVLEEYNDYGEDQNKGGVLSIPEVLNPNSLTFWSVKPNVKVFTGSAFNDFLEPKNVDFFNSRLPKIEILKNKLFTLKYNDGNEESFLFNVKRLDDSNENNQRGVLQFELANEDVKKDGSNSTSKDMVWKFFIIDNECYLALSSNQLNRINLNLHSPDDGIEVFSEQYNSIRFTETFDSYYKSITTGSGIYLSRNKDIYMKLSKYINPPEIIFLFKLK